MRASFRRAGARLALAAAAGALLCPPAGAAPEAHRASAESEKALSPSAQRAYETARDKLVQVRTLLKDQDSQASVGSGFVVSADGLIITNYHVVSQIALQPQRYRLTYTRAGGASGALQLLAFDAVHDLALARLLPPDAAGGPAGAAPADLGYATLGFRPRTQALANGERIFSLGNPLDIGFAVLEGNYNGLVNRSFYPQIFFAGALSPGMSGGPALDGQGRVIGVNVATRLDGQEVSFLVPAQFAQELLERGRAASPITGDSYPELTRQLLEHQANLVERFLALPWRSAGHARYRIPVPQEDFMRCWGSSSRAESKGLEFQSSECHMESALFISDQLRTGNLTVRHEAYDGSRLGTLRFAEAYSNRFRMKRVGGAAATTAPECRETFADLDGLPARTVVCLSAYRKLKGLYDLSVLVATVDASQQGAQGRLDARGVDFDNALRLVDYYLHGYGWNGSH
jgi:S1-C subfamily serine protease